MAKNSPASGFTVVTRVLSQLPDQVQQAEGGIVEALMMALCTIGPSTSPTPHVTESPRTRCVLIFILFIFVFLLFHDHLSACGLGGVDTLECLLQRG